MRSMYIDCSMGIAGDMFTAALLDAMSESERQAFADEFNKLGIPGVLMSIEESEKCGIKGTHVRIRIHGVEESEDMHEHHEGDGHSHHSHNGMKDIEAVVRGLDLSDRVKDDVMAVYGHIAAAESKVHGETIEDIHFHEVGTMDAVADVTAVCMLMERVNAARVTASDVNTGSGTVKCAHGVLPVPAPATALILEGMPTYSDDIKSELTTPTGAALLKYFADDFGPMPSMRSPVMGIGMGTKDFERANCLRITIGENDEE